MAMLRTSLASAGVPTSAFLRLAELGRLDPVDDDGVEPLAIVLEKEQMIAIFEEFGTKHGAELQLRKGIQYLFAVGGLAGVGRSGKHGQELDIVFDGARIDALRNTRTRSSSGLAATIPSPSFGFNNRFLMMANSRPLPVMKLSQLRGLASRCKI